MGRRLYVGNLSYDTTELELREVFGKFGTVADAKVVMDRETGRPRLPVGAAAGSPYSFRDGF